MEAISATMLAIESSTRNGDDRLRMTIIVPPNHPMFDFDSTSGEVQLQPIVPGISLGAKCESGANKIYISDT